MKIKTAKRQRIAKIFGRIAEYSVSILILGGVLTEKINALAVVLGFALFMLFFLISVIAEPEKEG